MKDKKHQILLIVGFVFFLLSCQSAIGAENRQAALYKNKAQKYYWGNGVPQDLEMALSLYENAARLGDSEAQFITGGMYYTGKGTPVNMEKAFKYLQSATDNGVQNPDSNQALAQLYFSGEVVPQNYQKASEFYQLAAEGGKSEAQNELGFLYFTGQGVENDYDKALHWFEKAALQGLVMAQYNMGMMWYSGNTSLGQDFVKAHAWFSIAANAGHQEAIDVKGYLESLMSETELEESLVLSKALFKTIK